MQPLVRVVRGMGVLVALSVTLFLGPISERAAAEGPRVWRLFLTQALSDVSDMAFDSSGEGSVVVADRGRHQIFRVMLNGEVRLLAGAGLANRDGLSQEGGPAQTAHLGVLGGVAVSPVGDVFFTERFKKYTPGQSTRESFALRVVKARSDSIHTITQSAVKIPIEGSDGFLQFTEDFWWHRNFGVNDDGLLAYQHGHGVFKLYQTRTGQLHAAQLAGGGQDSPIAESRRATDINFAHSRRLPELRVFAGTQFFVTPRGFGVWFDNARILRAHRTHAEPGELGLWDMDMTELPRGKATELLQVVPESSGDLILQVKQEIWPIEGGNEGCVGLSRLTQQQGPRRIFPLGLCINRQDPNGGGSDGDPTAVPSPDPDAALLAGSDVRSPLLLPIPGGGFIMHDSDRAKGERDPKRGPYLRVVGMGGEDRVLWQILEQALESGHSHHHKHLAIETISTLRRIATRGHSNLDPWPSRALQKSHLAVLQANAVLQQLEARLGDVDSFQLEHRKPPKKNRVDYGEYGQEGDGREQLPPGDVFQDEIFGFTL